MKQRRAVVGGHICLDITPVFNGKKVLRVDEIIKPGKLVHVEEADVHTGGAVANTGLAMKLLGIDTKLMGKIGDDPFGKMVLSILNSYNAADGMIIDKQATTSYSIVLAIPGIDRVFLHNPGSNDDFSSTDIKLEELKGNDLFHFGYPPLMKKMYQQNGEELYKLFKSVDELGIVTSLDLAAVDSTSEAGQQDWETILRKVLPYVDFFVPSVEEVYYMLDRERYEKCLDKAGNRDITEILSIEDDIKPLADKLYEMGAKNILIKCGAPGLYYKTAGENEIKRIENKLNQKMTSWIDKEGFENSYKPKKVLSGTGAGDTTIAAFLSSMLQGYSLEKSLQLATATGASCVASYDALGGILSLEEQMESINAGLEKQHLIKN